MARYEVVIPPLDVARRFNELFTQLSAIIRSNIFQSQALATIRDALLPKLLSGEVRVGEAERALATVV